MGSFLLMFHHFLLNAGIGVVLVPALVAVVSSLALLRLVGRDTSSSQAREVCAAMELGPIPRLGTQKR